MADLSKVYLQKVLDGAQPVPSLEPEDDLWNKMQELLAAQFDPETNGQCFKEDEYYRTTYEAFLKDIQGVKQTVDGLGSLTHIMLMAPQYAHIKPQIDAIADMIAQNDVQRTIHTVYEDYIENPVERVRNAVRETQSYVHLKASAAPQTEFSF